MWGQIPGEYTIFLCIIIPNHLLYFIVYYVIYLPSSQHIEYTQQRTLAPPGFLSCDPLHDQPIQS